ncbi:MAG: ThuA domain-containing protein, partial [Eubacterium sp.]|nr:ThuA domain-containing protein [Eubacterium sp.]
ERLVCIDPAHPIAAGIDEPIELAQEEMYGEFFDIPKPDETVFLGWFSDGNVFRSGVTFTRGRGRIFYFQPGHEEYPIYYDPAIRKIIRNAVYWATPYKKLSSDYECTAE